MAVRKINENPKITDTIQIDFTTTDTNGELINPYSVDKVIIYYVERDFTNSSNNTMLEELSPNKYSIMYFNDTIPVIFYGNENEYAYDSTNTDSAYIEKIDYDEDGNYLTGHFRATWYPKMAKEGDYMVCYTWTPYVASDKFSAYKIFNLLSDTVATASLPSHRTVEGKYEKLLSLYLPEMYKLKLTATDMTPDVLDRFNKSVAQGFTLLEDLANQLIDLCDANVCNEYYLPYLSNFFGLKLRSNDPTLWRRQIKTAVSNLKRKGTLDGLINALDSAGINFVSLTQYWQVVSKATYQDGFIVSDEESFILTKSAILPVDPSNFELYIRYNDTTEYVSLSLDYVSFENDINSITTMTWVSEGVPGTPIYLNENDVIRIIYKVKEPLDQNVEDYIRTLPLADDRDELLYTNPKKNWNVRLIEKDDLMFSLIVKNIHPFSHPVVWGKVRTDFAYSENIYNMDEYNGSFRNSNYPCDIDSTFVDSCSDCLGSYISFNVEIEDINNDRIKETEEIIKEFVPFHAQIKTINYSGSINEFFVSPVEQIEVLNYVSMEEFVFLGQNDFIRTIPTLNSETGLLKRNMLSSSTEVVSSDSCNAYNSEIVLYAPDYNLKTLGINVDSSYTLLEILSGVNAGEYTVENPLVNSVKIIQGSPDSITYPLNTSAFTFNLSNKVINDSGASIYQDDVYTFSEEDVNFINLNLETTLSGGSPSKLVITSGAYAGSYEIYDVLPNNSLVVLSFPATSNITSLKYKITDNSEAEIYLNKMVDGDGVLSVSRRGRVETIDFSGYGVSNGFYVRYDGSDYKVIGFSDVDKIYIENYTSGNVVGVNIDIYSRLINQGVGYVDVNGMYIITPIDYESGLDIQNGSNPPLVPIEDSKFKENFLVEIDGNYYQISNWDSTRIDILGPKVDWGLSGTAVTYSIIKYSYTADITHISPHDQEEIQFQTIDRRGREVLNIKTEEAMLYGSIPSGIAQNIMNGSNGIVDNMESQESISFSIEWEDGKESEEGKI